MSPNSAGRTRTNTASNSVVSASSPLKIRTWVRSAASDGANRIRPRPSRTIAVGPSRRLGDERRAGRDLEREIGRLNGEIAQLELLRRIEGELVESADGGQLLDLGDAPRRSRCRRAGRRRRARS